jgi:hypothetical protein
MRKLGSAAALVALLAAGCGATAGGDGVASVSSTANEVTVYYYEVVEKRPELHRQPFRLVPVNVAVEDTGDAATNAVGGLLQNEPAGDRLHTTWHGDNCAPAGAVRAVHRSPDLITVDLVAVSDSDEAGRAVCDMSQEGAAIQVQQMVWTVHRATGSDAPVQIMIEGSRFGSATSADPKVAPLPDREAVDRRLTRPAGAQGGVEY